MLRNNETLSKVLCYIMQYLYLNNIEYYIVSSKIFVQYKCMYNNEFSETRNKFKKHLVAI